MSDPAFFGYGSLVNLNTHNYENPTRATLKGWRRVWQQSGSRSVAFLSVLPHETSEIDGLIATVPNADWDALDAREHAYDRIDITQEFERKMPVAIYQATPSKLAPPTAGFPILLSYLDVVIQGFLREFGEAGVQRFFDTTDRWDTPIRNDRISPVYPRHMVLEPSETALVDWHLQRLSAEMV